MSNDEARCVVLTPPDAAMSDSLRDILVQRSWRCVSIDDPLLAMAELCLEDRARSTRRTWSPEAEQNIALVLDVPVEYDATNGPCRDLLAAVTQYLPGASIWTHRDGELTPLRSAGPANGEAPARPAPARPAPARPAPARPAPARPARPRTEPAATSPSEACEITPEEIEMLLGTGDDDDAHR